MFMKYLWRFSRASRADCGSWRDVAGEVLGSLEIGTDSGFPLCLDMEFTITGYYASALIKGKPLRICGAQLAYHLRWLSMRDDQVNPDGV